MKEETFKRERGQHLKKGLTQRETKRLRKGKTKEKGFFYNIFSEKKERGKKEKHANEEEKRKNKSGEGAFFEEGT